MAHILEELLTRVLAAEAKAELAEADFLDYVGNQKRRDAEYRADWEAGKSRRDADYAARLKAWNDADHASRLDDVAWKTRRPCELQWLRWAHEDRLKDDRQRLILEMREAGASFGLIATVTGVSTGRVSQIHFDGVERLHKAARRRKKPAAEAPPAQVDIERILVGIDMLLEGQVFSTPSSETGPSQQNVPQ